MKLDRNLNKTGVGKYALLKLRQMRTEMSPEIYGAVKTLETAGILDWGNAPETEFFVMREDHEPRPWTPGQCAGYAGRGVHLMRCKRKDGHGTGSLFCTQHAKTNGY